MWPEGHNWITRNCRKSLRVSRMSIPGTHDTFSYNMKGNVFSRFFRNVIKCQDMTFSEQIQQGIRFFDVRLCIRDDFSVSIVHGPSYLCDINFLVTPILEFFKRLDNEYDFVILRIKQECSNRSDFGNVIFKETGPLGCLRQYLWKPQNSKCFPTIQELRRKIFVLREYELGDDDQENDYGLNFDSKMIKLSDKFKVEEHFIHAVCGNFCNKWAHVKENILFASIFCRDIQKEKLHCTFCSSNSFANLGGWYSLIFFTGLPLSVAKNINNNLLKFLEQEKDVSCTGVLALDYPDVTPSLIQKIGELNCSTQLDGVTVPVSFCIFTLSFFCGCYHFFTVFFFFFGASSLLFGFY